jgi:hypothetical protein
MTLPMPGTLRTGSVDTKAITAWREGSIPYWPFGLLMSAHTWPNQRIRKGEHCTG